MSTPLNFGPDYWNRYRTYSANAPWSSPGGGKGKITDPRRYTKSPASTASSRLDTGDLTGASRDAASALVQLFRQYGLESLAPKIVEYVRNGYGSDTIALLLQDTPEWKRRFAGNEARRKAGLPILSPSEYLATENSYRQIMAQYGMPKGFYDSHADLAGFIGRDISASELQGRVQLASQFANSQDPATKESLRRLYGLGPGDLAAWALDPAKASPILERQAKAAQAGAAAIRHGVGVSKSYAEHLADLGITSDQAEQGYAQISQMLPTYEDLGRIYGQGYTQRTAEAEVFEGNATATNRRKSLASQERAAFSGSSRGQVGRSGRGSNY